MTLQYFSGLKSMSVNNIDVSIQVFRYISMYQYKYNQYIDVSIQVFRYISMYQYKYNQYIDVSIQVLQYRCINTSISLPCLWKVFSQPICLRL